MAAIGCQTSVFSVSNSAASAPPCTTAASSQRSPVTDRCIRKCPAPGLHGRDQWSSSAVRTLASYVWFRSVSCLVSFGLVFAGTRWQVFGVVAARPSAHVGIGQPSFALTPRYLTERDLLHIRRPRIPANDEHRCCMSVRVMQHAAGLRWPRGRTVDFMSAFGSFATFRHALIASWRLSPCSYRSSSSFARHSGDAPSKAVHAAARRAAVNAFTRYRRQ